jgi:hypothetical protein
MTTRAHGTCAQIVIRQNGSYGLHPSGPLTTANDVAKTDHVLLTLYLFLSSFFYQWQALYRHMVESVPSFSYISICKSTRIICFYLSAGL